MSKGIKRKTKIAFSDKKEAIITLPKMCNKKSCSFYCSILYLKCALNYECFKECRESGYKKHYEAKNV